MTIQRTLPDLAAQINAEHEACLAAARDAITRAIEVGRLLSEAKSQLQHGEWAGWVEANCTFRQREARNYMRVYRHRRQIGNGVADFGSLREAIAALTEPKALEPGLEPYPERAVEPEPVPEPAPEPEGEPTDEFTAIITATNMLAALVWDPDRYAMRTTEWGEQLWEAEDAVAAALVAVVKEFGKEHDPKRYTPPGDSMDALQWYVRAVRILGHAAKVLSERRIRDDRWLGKTWRKCTKHLSQDQRQEFRVKTGITARALKETLELSAIPEEAFERQIAKAYKNPFGELLSRKLARLGRQYRRSKQKKAMLRAASLRAKEAPDSSKADAPPAKP
jgi:hypothetical protein